MMCASVKMKSRVAFVIILTFFLKFVKKVPKRYLYSRFHVGNEDTSKTLVRLRISALTVMDRKHGEKITGKREKYGLEERLGQAVRGIGARSCIDLCCIGGNYR